MKGRPASRINAFPPGADWFRPLFERSAEAMALCDPVSGNFIAQNEASARAIGGDDAEELAGLSPDDFAPEFQPDGRRSGEVIREAAAQALEKGSHRFEWQVRRRDGACAFYDVVLTALELEGRPVLLSAARNIDERKRQEEELRLAESRWRRVFEQAPMSLQIFSPDGSTREVNRSFEKLFQLVLPELQEFNIRTDAQLAAAGLGDQIERAFTGGISVIPPIPFELKATPGQPARGVKWIGSTMFPVFDGQGRIAEVVCVHEDDTERKAAQEEVRQLHQSLEQRIAERTKEWQASEEKFRLLFELSPLGISQIDWQGRFLRVNPSFARTVGRTQEEMLRMTYWDITPEKYQEQELQVLEAIKEHGHAGPFEKEYIHADGHSIPIVLYGVLVRSPDGQEQLWGITQDVTESRRAEQAVRESERKYRLLFETSSQGVMLHDEHQFFADVNQAAAGIFGLTPEALIGRHPAELAPEFQPDGQRSEDVARRHIAHCLEHGLARFEWTHLHSQGHEILMEVVLSRITDGDLHLVQAVVTDISERRRAETELKKALERERELNQLKSDFVAMVSHEFRTPLGIIQSSAEILSDYLEQLAPSERREQLNSIIKNSRRMAGLMEDVLLLGRLDAGRMEYRPGPMDLAAFCRRLMDEVDSAMESRCPIEFSTEGLPPETQADERLLRHMLVNLLTNAVKYSHDGVPVTFKASATPAGVRFTVCDRGIGIPSEEQPHLFESFRRGSNVGSRQGTGLGLVIVKRSVGLHGGQLRLTSQPGQGTTAIIDLPL